MKKIIVLIFVFISTVSVAQDISFTFVNARNTNDGANDFYEADIYIASDSDFIIGSGQIYFNYNTAAFGESIHTNGNFEMLQPDGSVLATSFFGGAVAAYTSFIVNDNTSSRVSTSFQQLASSGTISTNNVTGIPTHLFSIKIKYIDSNESPNVSFEEGSVFLDQFFTACGPTTAGFATADCTNTPGVQITGDSFNSSGAVIITSATWTGTTDSVWNTANNWDINTVPETTYDIIIPNVTTTPLINSGILVQTDDFTVEASSSFSITGSGAMEVVGNFTNNGSVNLTSDTTNSSSLIVKGISNGVVTYEREGLVANQWHLVSAPVEGQSIKEFAENAANNIRINTTVTPNRYAIAYYEDSNADGAKWVYYTTDDLTTNTLTFEKGRGYIISRGTNGSVTFTGTLETNSVAKPIIASEWNAIGNPFTAFLPLNENSGDNFIADNTGQMDPSYVAAYVWDALQAKYVANSLLGAESSLAPGQGFFIRAASDATSITLDEDQRIVQPVTGSVFSRENKQTPSIELIASNEKVSVKTTINFLENATKGLDIGFDIGNFKGAEFDVYTHLVEGVKDTDFTIQSLPLLKEGYNSIPIGLTAIAGTKLNLTVNTKALSDTFDVFIEDKVLNTFINIENSGYEVELKGKEEGIGRFYLHIQSKVASVASTEITPLKVFTVNNNLKVEGIIQNSFNVEVYDISGKQIFNTKQEGTRKNNIVLPKVSTGVYLVKISSILGESNHKVIIE